MAEQRVQRRLAAILAADVVGYSRLMRDDEEGTLAALTAQHIELIEPCIAEHNGRVVKTMGDGLLAEFVSVVDAVRCAVAFQEGVRKRNGDYPEDRRIVFRIGVNLGDVIVQDGDVFGDGVNVAARLEGLAVPGGICVSGSVREQVANRLEVGFRDLGPQHVKNIGDPVRAYLVHVQAAARPRPEPAEMPSLPDKPSIAVLPFENMSADPEQAYFSDGITEDIITELSKISGLFVIARHSAFTYKGKSVSLRQVGRELGVHYVLEGSVRKAGQRLRITAQLIDAASDHHLWAERYDRGIEDIFAVQDEVARNVASALAVALTPDERKQLAHTPTDNLEAYDLYIRARTRPWPPTRDNILSAQHAFAHVIDVDSTFVGGYAGRSMAYSLSVIFGHSDIPEDDAQTAMELAKRAVKLDEEFAGSHSALGTAYTAVGRHTEAIAAARRAIELQPGDADSHANCARCLMFSGLGNEAAEMVRVALRLDPQYVEGPYLNLIGRSLFVAKRYAEAIEAFERNRNRGGPPTFVGHSGLNWIAACSLSGRDDLVPALVQEQLRYHPTLTITNFRLYRGLFCEGELEPLVRGLRLAGWPE